MLSEVDNEFDTSWRYDSTKPPTLESPHKSLDIKIDSCLSWKLNINKLLSKTQQIFFYSNPLLTYYY